MGGRQESDSSPLAAVGFRDDPTKGNAEELRLEMEGRPEWTPGRSMKTPTHARTAAVIPK